MILDADTDMSHLETLEDWVKKQKGGYRLFLKRLNEEHGRKYPTSELITVDDIVEWSLGERVGKKINKSLEAIGTPPGLVRLK